MVLTFWEARGRVVLDADLQQVKWPGGSYSAYLQSHDPEYQTWYGSLVADQRDATGLSYRRNRFYDPESGQFTQEDPIGIAGGLNLYGYAGGDPVNFSDPFGLCPQWLTGRPCQNPLGGTPLNVRISETNRDVGMFGMVRDGGTRPHRGVDILAMRGTNVTSVDDGVVIDIQTGGAGGNLIKIGHNDADGNLASVSVYMHLADKPSLPIGATVSAGQVVGAVGRTGNITKEATHLHFELRTSIFGGQIDPIPELGVNHQ